MTASTILYTPRPIAELPVACAACGWDADGALRVIDQYLDQYPPIPAGPNAYGWLHLVDGDSDEGEYADCDGCGGCGAYLHVGGYDLPATVVERHRDHSPLDANRWRDEWLVGKLLAGFGLARGSTIVCVENTRRERRRYLGEIRWANVSADGRVTVTIAGCSSWAPSSTQVTLIGRGHVRVERVATADDLAGGHSLERPANRRERVA